MNILFVSDTYFPHVNGVYYFVCRIGPILRKRGHNVAVVAPAEGGRFTKKVIDSIDVYGMPSVPIMVYPKLRVPIPFFLRSRITHLLRGFCPDVIHIQDHFRLSREVIAVGKTMGIPVIATNHFLPENLTAFLPSKLWRRLAENKMWCGFSKVYNQVSLVTTPTETAAKLIRPKLNVDVLAVSSGIDLEQFTPHGETQDIRRKYGIPPGPILLFVGRLDPEKKLEQVVKAVKLASGSTVFTLVMVGRGVRSAALQTLSRQLRINHRVVFTGFVPEADLPFLYQASRCFIIASEAELLSLATLQAVASGLPVIAANAGALGELVQNNVNGFLFKPGDISGMSDHIVKLMTDDRLCRQMSQMSLKIAPTHDLNRSADIFESIYEGESTNWELQVKP
jgi:1,2-diacylglycerol 3-alpha-glucosyltransferase